jgi:hypothetical protein
MLDATKLTLQNKVSSRSYWKRVHINMTKHLGKRDLFTVSSPLSPSLEFTISGIYYSSSEPMGDGLNVSCSYMPFTS